MKQIFSLLLISAFCLQSASAQNSSRAAVLGLYTQTALVAPDAYRDGENDVSITQDSKATKKLWVHDLIPGQKFYAILHLNSDGTLIYAVPKQKVGNYIINMGCITFEDGDITISLNNKNNCFGMSQKDWDKPVSVSGKGIEAGDVKIGSDGSIKGAGVDMGKDGIKVNTKEVMAGIQYVGKKAGKS